MEFETIAAVWDDYRKHVLPENCGPIQLTETRRAFYAGTCVMLRMSCEVCQLPEGEAVAKFEQWTQEGWDFLQESQRLAREALAQQRAELLQDVKRAVDTVNRTVTGEEATD